jgi:hypothetical protein
MTIAGAQETRTENLPRMTRRPEQLPGKDPCFVVLGYYALTLGSLMFVMYQYPGARECLPVGDLDDLIGGNPFAPAPGELTPATRPTVKDLPWRAVALLSALIGTLLFVAPVAWVYNRAREGRSTGPVLETLLLLPIGVAPVVIIIQNSIALAFSLFGIVAAVRCRNTLPTRCSYSPH